MNQATAKEIGPFQFGRTLILACQCPFSEASSVELLERLVNLKRVRIGHISNEWVSKCPIGRPNGVKLLERLVVSLISLRFQNNQPIPAKRCQIAGKIGCHFIGFLFALNNKNRFE